MKTSIYRFISLFSVIRGYDILLLIIAQYLSAIFILAPEKPIRSIVFDPTLFMLVLSSGLSIAGGYVINSFYDFEKDIINRPFSTMIERLIGQHQKLSFYFILNFLSVIVAGYVSYKALLFFSAYIFGMWIYSHRLKRITFVGNWISTLLSTIPFFAIFLYYKNTNTVIFVHAVFLFLLMLVKDLTKDLIGIAGDLTHNYQTIPVKYGIFKSKIIISFVTILSFLPMWKLIFGDSSIGKMKYYFFAVGLFLCVFLFLLWRSEKRYYYAILYRLLKAVLILGVFSIALISR